MNDDLTTLNYLERARALYELASRITDPDARALICAAARDFEELGSHGLDEDLDEIEI